VNEIEHYSKMSKLELLKIQHGIVLHYGTVSDYVRRIESLIAVIRSSPVIVTDTSGTYFELESFIQSRLTENASIERFKSVAALLRNAETNYTEQSRALLREIAKTQRVDDAMTLWIRRYLEIEDASRVGNALSGIPRNALASAADTDIGIAWEKATPGDEAIAHGHQTIAMGDQLRDIVDDIFSEHTKDDYLNLLKRIDTQIKLHGEALRVKKIYFAGSIALLCVLVLVVMGMLIHAMRQLSEAKFELEARVDARTRELSTKSDELERYRDELEQQVNERTRQLHVKAQDLVTALIKEQHASRLQKDFVSMISHEFRTPVAIIDMAAQRILRKKQALLDGNAVEEFANGVRRNVQRLTGLIDRTLTLSKFDEGKIDLSPQRFDLAHLLDTICVQQRKLDPSTPIHIQVEPELPSIVGDMQLLEQVFTNLIGNAVKYSPDKSAVVVRAGHEEGQVRVEVIDQGIGIPEKETSKLFERYFRASNARVIAGTGLGLSITKEMVELHNGSLRVVTAEGKGSAFIVTLPVEGPNSNQAIERGNVA
jgi:signal transduction histidine kinase